MKTPLLVTLACIPLATPVHAAPTAVPVIRDRWGVPHVFVPTSIGNRVTQLRALGTTFGYAMARDRMYLLELSRRTTTGHLAELPFTGRAFLEGDVAIRRDRLTDAERRAAVHRLPSRLRIIVEGFGDGVNLFLDEMRADPSKAPVEFFFPGLDPTSVARWRLEDTAALAEYVRAVESGGGEVENAVVLLDLLDRFPKPEAEGIFTDLFWLEDPTAPTTIDPSDDTFPPPRMTPFAPAQLDLLTRYAPQLRAAVESGVAGAFGAPMSNALAIGGALTATGAPILMGGPQVGLRVPNPFFEIGLHGGGYDAEVLLPPGWAGIGRTSRAAWTITSTVTDAIDVFVEELDPADPHQYRYRGGLRAMDCREEVFHIAGEVAPETRELCRTVHGPVFATFPDAGVAFSRRFFVAGRELASATALFGLGFATSLRQFRRMVDRIDSAVNVTYADADGNIAMFTRGIRPRRRSGFDPRLPLPGTGAAEPERVLRGKAMPKIVNPPSGFLAQWNNKPILGWSSDELRELWGGASRVQVLIDQVRALGRPITRADVEDFLRVAATTDFFAPLVFPFLRDAVAALPDTVADRAALAAAVGLVDAWLRAGGPLVADTSGTIPYPGLTIYREWRQRVQSATFADELGPHVRTVFYFQTNVSGNQDDSGSLFTPDALFLRALAGPAAPFPTSRDYFADVSAGTTPGRDATLVAALRATLQALAGRFDTPDMAAWLTPRITVEFFDDAGSDLYYGPITMERQNRGTVNVVIELGPSPAGEVVVPPGNSNHIPRKPFPQPPHLRDQLPLYEEFRFRTWPFAREDLEPPLTEEIVPAAASSADGSPKR